MGNITQNKMSEWAPPIGCSDSEDDWSEISSASDVESVHDEEEESSVVESEPGTSDPEPTTLERCYGLPKSRGALSLAQILGISMLSLCIAWFALSKHLYRVER